MSNVRKHIFLPLALLVVLAVCNAAAACSVTVTIVGDSVAKGTTNDAVRLDISVSDTFTGKITVKPSHSGANTGRITIWNKEKTVKKSENEGEFNITITEATQYPIQLWVQGVATSSAVPDVTITATLKDAGDNTIDTKSDTVTVVEVDDVVQYQSGANWVNISGTLYVMQGTTVTFKAIPKPAAASWPTAPPSNKPVWEGESGTTNPDKTRDVVFNATGDKTVTAQCGNTVPVNVKVYSLTGYHIAQDWFTGRHTTKYGVAEVADISFTVDPSGITAAQMGGLEWSKVAGEGTVNNTGTTGTGTYTAHWTTSSVTLRLTVQSGPSKDRYVDMAFTVTKPTGGRCVKRAGSNIWHVINTYSIGVNTDFYLDPKDVSFSRIKFKEGTCVSVTTGWHDNIPAFKNETHDAWGTWYSVGTGNITTGCKVTLPNGDYAWQQHHNPPAYAPGTYKWSIPWLYTTDNGTTSHQITTVDQDFTVAANGDATVKKDNTPPYQNNHSNASQGW